MTERASENPGWSQGQRLSFRFAATYAALYGLLNGNLATLPLSLVSRHGEAPAWATAPGRAIARATAWAFHVSTSSVPTDNGDGLGDWLLILGLVIASAIATSVWTFVGRDRRDYRRELPWLLAGLRFLLAGNVSAYAFWKIVPAQFSQLDPTRYFHTYGQASPMGLLWMFMGVCPAYQMFAGWMELAGAALLLFRRTALAGALLLLVVLGNVVALDLAFDVDAKMCILHLWLMALAIAAPSLRRLIEVVVLHRAAAKIELGPPARPAIWLAKGAFVVAVVGSQVPPALEAYRTLRDGRPLPRFSGAYDVEEMRRDGVLVPPLLSDPTYWQHLAIGRPGAVAYLVSGKRRAFALSTDAAGTMWLASEASSLRVEQPGEDELRLDGQLDGAPASIRIRRTAAANELLVTRGFHWVNEEPFTR